MLDKFARTYGIPFPGGPVIEKKAREWIEANPGHDMSGLELPYAVQGMDLAFSGVMTAACRLVEGDRFFFASAIFLAKSFSLGLLCCPVGDLV